MSEHNKIIDKIRKLIAKAEGTTNEHEAETFAAKVQELLLQHNLSMAAIGTAEQTAEQIKEGDMLDNTFLKSPARQILLGAVCRYYMCDWVKFGRRGVAIVGRPSNATVAKEMMDYLLATTIRLSNEYARKTHGDRIDFRRGCMGRLAERLNKMRYEREQAAKNLSTGNTLPVLFVNESEAVRAFLASDRYKTGRPLHLKQGAHAAAGRQAAEGIGFDPQVRGDNQKRIGGK